MKSKNKNIILLGIYLVLLIILGLGMPTEIDWRPTFSGDDKIPYGDYVLYNRMNDICRPVTRLTKPATFYSFYQYLEDRNFPTLTNIVIINDVFNADELDVTAMCSYVANGNNVFIATTQLPKKLIDTLGVDYKEKALIGLNLPRRDSSLPYVLNLYQPGVYKPGGYRYKSEYVAQAIVDADTAVADTLFEKPGHILPRINLGSDNEGHVNFVQVPFGKGNFYIHSFPLAFTNYYMLKDDNFNYVSACLSYLPNQKTYWDEYYKPFRHDKPQTPLRFVLSTASLRWAYYAGMVSLLIYVLLSLKREQRPIPIIKPFKNLSLDFTRTIGTLYYQQHDHRDLAAKKMSYLLEKIRNNYFLPTDRPDAIFQEKLAQKSNVPLETVSKIFSIYAGEIKDAGSVTESVLQEFNSAIEKFYTQSGLINK